MFEIPPHPDCTFDSLQSVSRKLPAVPGLAQEGCVLTIRSPNKPLPEGRVAEHAGFVSPLNEEAGERLHPLLEVLPSLLPLDVARINSLEDLLVRHGVEGRERHVQNRKRSLEGGLGHELHVALQQVELGQRHGHHLVAGTFDDQVSPLEEVQGELEVQVGTEAPQHQVAAHFPDQGGVGLAVQGDVAEDVLAAVDPVLDVGVQVTVNVFVVREVIQGKLDKWQRAYDLLRGRGKRNPKTHGVTPQRFLFYGSCISNQIH